MIRRALLVALAAGPALAACSFPPTTMTPAAVEAFLETPLPPGRRDLRTYTEAGIDRLVLLRLDAPEAEAAAFAAHLVPEGLEAGADPGLGLLSTSFDGWIAAPPEGSAGGERMIGGRRAVKVVVAPAELGWRRVWVASFTL
ncbi:hypothetical protein ASF53_08220 [Methylobacterium sp. Leaf123]|uniref:hypothetical protein n=1 Tax=Methylobacterium sp. Leaf123 TaxID=1736264 RepID=UPI0006FFB429|nr:hypothetical protein [Methylobacterium sp. Leaf123]KQQ14610.1 hypothetical protein ASF53_08220 [Methylobacterium sp. Leaf123]